MKIVFWGTPNYAAENLVCLINSGHNIIAVVSQPDRKRGRGKGLTPSPVKKIAIDFGIPIVTTKSIRKDDAAKKLLQDLNADVYLVVAFGQILPIEILNQPKLGCWNSHASLLPKWRGAAPIQWSIMNDDLQTGVCIMSMETGLDTGPVIIHQNIEIKDSDNLEILSNRLSKISSRLLLDCLESLKDTQGLDKDSRLKKLKAVKQSNLIGIPSYARQLNKEDYLIDWKKNSRIIFKKILGLFPNAYTKYNGKRIKIIEINLLNDRDKFLNRKMYDLSLKEKREPGGIISITKNYGIIVMTNDFPIIIKYCQLEGKKKTDSYTLSIQAGLKEGDILGN